MSIIKNIKTRIQFKRDTTENWGKNKNYIPAVGEPCFDINTYKLKIGDGVHSYEQLPYINGDLSTDGKSIVFTDDSLKIVGFDIAENGAQPVKGEDGTLKWVVPSTEDIDELKKNMISIKELVGDDPVSKQITKAINEIDIDEISKINAISINGVLLQRINKQVNIPMATDNTLGVVSGSDEISISETGGINVKKINIDKIIQDADQVIIFDNGNSND